MFSGADGSIVRELAVALPVGSSSGPSSLAAAVAELQETVGALSEQIPALRAENSSLGSENARHRAEVDQIRALMTDGSHPRQQNAGLPAEVAPRSGDVMPDRRGLISIVRDERIAALES